MKALLKTWIDQQPFDLYINYQLSHALPIKYKILLLKRFYFLHNIIK